MLRSWRSRIPDDDSQDQLNADQLKLMAEREQLRMFLTGEGGTGKSRVIDAVEAFCKSWHRPHALAKTAMTGKVLLDVLFTVGLVCTTLSLTSPTKQAQQHTEEYLVTRLN